MKKSVLYLLLLASILFFFSLAIPLSAEILTGEGPNLGENRITQDDISNLPLKKNLAAGLRIFTTPFNLQDGYGDGPFDPLEGNPRDFGNRPTLQQNGTFLRVNGLDGQTCLECHFITRNSTIPATFGVGGVAGGANHPIFRPSFINVAEVNDLNSKVPDTEPGDFNGRFINPPFLFGSGGIELVAKEMTICLQEIKDKAQNNPGVYDLIAKGVNFGKIGYNLTDGFDYDNIEGIDEDLVVRPFGRKGEFSTVRAFDLGAMQFHFGMQPVEVVGDEDSDGDGVSNELLIGEISALHIFLTTRAKPVEEKLTDKKGFKKFEEIGCIACHKPSFNTDSRKLTYSFPEVEEDPKANIFYEVNLVSTAKFKPLPQGGIEVPSFSDLKRHDMGDGLKEDFDEVSDKTNREFITARLWGVRDTAPYLHDGRATTITEAILAHGGEAEDARSNFEGLSNGEQDKILAFLYSLRTPLNEPNVPLN